jgi:mediator of RNA polymerase II transcription subunit 14
MDHEITQPDPPISQNGGPNGIHNEIDHEPPLEELERELPFVNDGQIALGDLLSRVVQAIYAELSELSETLALLFFFRVLALIGSSIRMPNMSDTARKRTLADWVVKTKKQIVKLYAVTKWSRDANAVQKCMVSIISTSMWVSTQVIPLFRILLHSS